MLGYRYEESLTGPRPKEDESDDQSQMSDMHHDLRRGIEGERGYSLVELMVVVLIIGILIAVALPTFLGARARAQNRAAQSNLRTTLAAAKTSYVDNKSYSGATTAGLTAIERSVTYQAAGTASASSNNYAVSITTGNVTGTDQQTFAAARMSVSGTCYTIKDVAGAGGSGAGNTPRTWYGSTVIAANCTGTWARTNTSATKFP
jgi:type IV pilus assembly protein PilA